MVLHNLGEHVRRVHFIGLSLCILVYYRGTYNIVPNKKGPVYKLYISPYCSTSCQYFHTTKRVKSNLPRCLLYSQAWQLYQEERLKEIVDSDLEEYPEEEVIRYMKVALFCTQASAMRRPGMVQVVEMLSRPIRLNEKELTPPGFINDYNSIRNNAKMGIGTSSTNYPFKTSSSIDTAPFTSNSVSFTEVIPR